MHDLPLHFAVLLVVVGAASGFVNTVAGAGSLLSLRALMLLGASAGEANGTNRIPVIAQSLTAAIGFRKAEPAPRALLVAAAVPAVVGAIAGALLSTIVPDRVMNLVLIVVLFGVALLGLRKPKPAESNENRAEEELARLRSPSARIWTFFAGFSGGFVQAGVGLLLLHAFSNVARLSLIRGNSLKVNVVLAFSLVSAGIFIMNGQVNWLFAGLLSIGSIAGATLAVKLAIKAGDRLKWAVVLVDLAVCVVLIVREVSPFIE